MAKWMNQQDQNTAFRSFLVGTILLFVHWYLIGTYSTSRHGIFHGHTAIVSVKSVTPLGKMKLLTYAVCHKFTSSCIFNYISSLQFLCFNGVKWGEHKWRYVYHTVSDKGWRLGARRHKIIYILFSIGDPPRKYTPKNGVFGNLINNNKKEQYFSRFFFIVWKFKIMFGNIK